MTDHTRWGCERVMDGFNKWLVMFFHIQAEEKVRIDNLQESELQALLDEVLQYSGKRDGEKGSELFQVNMFIYKLCLIQNITKILCLYTPINTSCCKYFFRPY